MPSDFPGFNFVAEVGQFKVDPVAVYFPALGRNKNLGETVGKGEMLETEMLESVVGIKVIRPVTAKEILRIANM